MSAGGVDEQHGVTCSHFHEVPVKQMAMQRALQKFLIVDASKLGTVRAARFSGVADFNSVVSG
ncbi:hypothetical protein M8994_13720 [Brucella sp. 21LCYQ03]|nr:hypothetical protein [Brucella sp. 21LCYQ03]